MTADPGSRRNPEWAAEHVVGVEQARVLVGSQFPFLRGASVEQLSEGWDNTVHVVGSRWVFRFPRREVAVPLVRREIAVLPYVASRVPLPVPVPELVGRPSPAYPWPFWGARLIPGRELADTALPDAARAPLASAVGEFLAALHRPEHVAAVGADLAVDPLRRGDPGVRIPMARERLDRLDRRGLWSPNPAIERLFVQAADLGPSTAEPVVVHGDLHVRHLLADGRGQATGVIDWGDVCLADPAVDLALAYAAFSGPARTELLSAYGPIDRDRELRARVLAVMLSATLADYAADVGLAPLRLEALAGLRRAASP